MSAGTRGRNVVQSAKYAAKNTQKGREQDGPGCGVSESVGSRTAGGEESLGDGERSCDHRQDESKHQQPVSQFAHGIR